MTPDPPEEGGGRISVAKAAEILDISRQAVHLAILRGKLDGRKDGRNYTLDRASVETYKVNRWKR